METNGVRGQATGLITAERSMQWAQSAAVVLGHQGRRECDSEQLLSAIRIMTILVWHSMERDS
jgi:hypothetical protein